MNNSLFKKHEITFLSGSNKIAHVCVDGRSYCYYGKQARVPFIPEVETDLCGVCLYNARRFREEIEDILRENGARVKQINNQNLPMYPPFSREKSNEKDNKTARVQVKQLVETER